MARASGAIDNRPKRPNASRKGSSSREGKAEGSERPRSRLPIIAAIVTVLLIGGIGLVIFFGMGGVGSIVVGGVQMKEGGIWFEIRTSGKLFRSYSGDVDIELKVNDSSTDGGTRSLLFTDCRVESDYGSKEVPYVDFLQGNGEYWIEVSAGGLEDSTSFLVNNLVTFLDAEWSADLPDPSRPEYLVQVNITYIAGSRQPLSERFPSSFYLNGVLTGPGPTEATIVADNDIYIVQKAVPHTARGTYSIEAALLNLDCAEGAPGRAIHLTDNKTFHFDAPPFANAGLDQTVKLVGGEAIVDLDAGQSWDDGTISEYIWDFDDGTTLEGDEEDAALVRHIFNEAGVYVVTLSVKDDTGQTSVQDGMVSTAIITVEK